MPLPTNTKPWAEQFLDDTMRIVRLRGPKFEGRLNIFVRRRTSDSNDDDMGVDGTQANTGEPE